MGWIRKQYDKKVVEVKQGFAAKARIKKKAQAEYYRESERQALREAGAKAKMETDTRLKRYKERQKSPGFTFGGMAGPTQKKPSMSLGIADYLTGSGGGSRKKKKGKNPLEDMRLF